MSIEGSTIPNGSILAGSPSRVVYEIPKEGYIALKGRVTVRDYEITQCVVKILGDRQASLGECSFEERKQDSEA